MGSDQQRTSKVSSDQQLGSKLSSDRQQISKHLSNQQQTPKISFDQQLGSKLSTDQQQGSTNSTDQQQKSELSFDQPQTSKLSFDQQQGSKNSTDQQQKSKPSFDQPQTSKLSCSTTSNSIIESRISSCNNNEVNTKPKHVQADDNKSDDKNNRQNEGDGEQVTKSSLCPEGIDQDVFNQLPEDIKLEISQSMKLKKNQISNSIISNQMNQKSNSKSKGPKKRITPKSENIMKYFSRQK